MRAQLGALALGRRGDPHPDARADQRPAQDPRAPRRHDREPAVRALRPQPGDLGLRWSSLADEFAWVLDVLSCGQLGEWGKTEHSTQRRTAMPGILLEDLSEWRAALRRTGRGARASSLQPSRRSRSDPSSSRSSARHLCAAPRRHLPAPTYRGPPDRGERVRNEPENAQQPLRVSHRRPAATRTTIGRCRVAGSTGRTGEKSFCMRETRAPPQITTRRHVDGSRSLLGSPPVGRPDTRPSRRPCTPGTGSPLAFGATIGPWRLR